MENNFFIDNTPSIQLPLSKSIAARALICQAIYMFKTKLGPLPDCDDTRYLKEAMDAVFKISKRDNYCNLGEGAASLRFFVALIASYPGVDMYVDCMPQLRKRPIMPLIDILRSVGADITTAADRDPAFAGQIYPLHIKGKIIAPPDRKVEIPTDISSQFASAIAMAGKMWYAYSVKIPTEKMVSSSYYDMTLKVIDIFKNTPKFFRIEADWSAASYFYEFALLNPGREIRLANLINPLNSIQGDAACSEIFGKLGVETSISSEGGLIIRCEGSVLDEWIAGNRVFEANLRNTPDLVPALVVALAYSGIRFVIDGVGHLRFKESDRIAVLCEEMHKVGFLLTAGNDSISWDGLRCEADEVPMLDSHNDHRIAMALCAANEQMDDFHILHVEAVKKSFPGFFEELNKISSRKISTS